MKDDKYNELNPRLNVDNKQSLLISLSLKTDMSYAVWSETK